MNYDWVREYHRANPWKLVNADVLGQMCGLEATKELAIARAKASSVDGECWVNDAAREVLYRGGCYC